MFTLKAGDRVYHKGVKRKVTFVRNIFGDVFLHLTGFPFMAHPSTVKPIITLTPQTRLDMMLFAIAPKLIRNGDRVWRSVKLSNMSRPITRKEFENETAQVFLDGLDRRGLFSCSE